MIPVISSQVSRKIPNMDLDRLATDIKKKFVSMVLQKDSQDPEEDLLVFTNQQKRNESCEGTRVYKNGVSRCPHLNQSTGLVAMYVNPPVLNYATDPSILKVFADAYDVKLDELAMCRGPPTIVIKPSGAATSAPFVFDFSGPEERIKFTGVVSLTSHEAEPAGTGGIQLLEHFEIYYDFLKLFFSFDDKKRSDILYLEKWFSVEVANQAIADYTGCYNHYVRKIKWKGDRPLPRSIADIFKTHKPQVPEDVKYLSWKNLDMRQGELVLFSSRQALRTMNCKDLKARTYIQIAMEPRPPGWTSSSEYAELSSSYNTGKFGDWIKPGKKTYIKENRTEYNSLKPGELEEVRKIVGSKRLLFAL